MTRLAVLLDGEARAPSRPAPGAAARRRPRPPSRSSGGRGCPSAARGRRRRSGRRARRGREPSLPRTRPRAAPRPRASPPGEGAPGRRSPGPSTRPAARAGASPDEATTRPSRRSVHDSAGCTSRAGARRAGRARAASPSAEGRPGQGRASGAAEHVSRPVDLPRHHARGGEAQEQDDGGRHEERQQDDRDERDEEVGDDQLGPDAPEQVGRDPAEGAPGEPRRRRARGRPARGPAIAPGRPQSPSDRSPSSSHSREGRGDDAAGPRWRSEEACGPGYGARRRRAGSLGEKRLHARAESSTRALPLTAAPRSASVASGCSSLSSCWLAARRRAFPGPRRCRPTVSFARPPCRRPRRGGVVVGKSPPGRARS